LCQKCLVDLNGAQCRSDAEVLLLPQKCGFGEAESLFLGEVCNAVVVLLLPDVRAPALLEGRDLLVEPSGATRLKVGLLLPLPLAAPKLLVLPNELVVELVEVQEAALLARGVGQELLVVVAGPGGADLAPPMCRNSVTASLVAESYLLVDRLRYFARTSRYLAICTSVPSITALELKDKTRVQGNGIVAETNNAAPARHP
jgi:hypothetical protein